MDQNKSQKRSQNRYQNRYQHRSRISVLLAAGLSFVAGYSAVAASPISSSEFLVPELMADQRALLSSQDADSGTDAASDAQFLDGLAEIPFPPQMIMLDDPVVFDTASGTVARAKFHLRRTPESAIAWLEGANKGFGWSCARVNIEGEGVRITCNQTGRKLVWTAMPARVGSKMMMSLVPLSQ